MAKTENMPDVIKHALEQTIEGIQIVDFNWRYIYLNKAAARHGQAKSEDLIGKTMMESFTGIDQTPVFSELRHVMKNRKPRRVENEFTYPGGTKCWFELYIEPHSEGILVRSVDITEQKKIEEQLRHMQKMEAIGRLAGGMAHDFNNKLAVMRAYCDMSLEHIGNQDPVVYKYMENILKAVVESAALTKQLLAFSRRQVLNLKAVSLNDMLIESRDSLARLLGEGVRLELHLGKNLPVVMADPSQMDQVILNLSVNARDAMSNNGTLRIETSRVELGDEYVEKHLDVLPGPYVLLSFTDTGAGMDRETRNHIFEPFFTTKEKDKGTGLGLAMVHGIIKQSRGHIWVYSELGIGTVFKIYLPEASEKAIRTPASESQINVRGHETILLVEDDVLLREAYSVALEKVGYKVLAASDGEEAIRIFNTQGPVDIVLTDVILPKMNGKELVDTLRANTPGLKVIFMSGYTENSIVHKGVLQTESILLQKPFSIQSLLETLRKVLEGTLRKGVI